MGLNWRPVGADAATCSSRPANSAGASLLELVAVLGIVSCTLGIGLPTLAQMSDARRVQAAARFIAGQFRLARQRAAMTGRHVAIVFEGPDDALTWRVCIDDDRDGVSRQDIDSGVDRCDAMAEPLSVRFPGVLVAYAPGVPSPDGQSGVSPLRFGLARMAAFSPTGTATSGTLALLGQDDGQMAVRVAGVTGRSRVLRFDRGRSMWTE